MIEFTITIYYCIVVDALSMSKETKINLLQNETNKYDVLKILANIWNQRMKQLKLASIGIDNKIHVKDIVALNKFLFPDNSC